MDLAQTTELLAYVHLHDKRQIDELTIRDWHDLLGDLDFKDCWQAVKTHRMTSTDYLQVAHVRAGAMAARRTRRDAERKAEIEASGPAAFQRTPEEQAAITANAARVRRMIEGAAAKHALPAADEHHEPAPGLREPDGAFAADLARRGITPETS